MPISERERIDHHDLRLRTMIESWERNGLIGPDVAARALTPRCEQPETTSRPPRRRGPLVWIGYLVAIPVPTVLVLIDAYVGPGTLLLMGLLVVVASPTGRSTVRPQPRDQRPTRSC